MPDNKVITAVFGSTSQLCRTRAIWQYDRGRQLQISGITLPTSYQVQFANGPAATAKPIAVYDSDTVEIPEEFTQSGQPVYAYIYITGDEYGITKRLALIPVQARGAIDDAQPTPQEASTIDALIEALNSGVSDAVVAKDAAKAYATDAQTAQTAAETAKTAAETAAQQAATVQSDVFAARDAAIAAKTAAETAQTQAGQSAQSASESASSAATEAENAAQSAQTAIEAQADAETAKSGAETAVREAQTAAEQAKSEREQAVIAAGNAQQSATAAAQSATAANTAKTGAETARTGAETAQTASEAAQTSAAASAAAAQAVKDSIPQDYTSLNNDVSELKSAVDNKVDKPVSLTPLTISTAYGYYPSTGGYISTSLYQCAECAVTPGDVLYLSGSGDTAKPAYIFTNSAKNTIISKAEEALELSDYKITVPAGAGYVRLNSAGTNKTLAVKKASIDSDFDINDLVGTVDTLSTNMTGLQSDVDALESTSLVSKTAVSGTNFDSVDVNTVYDVNISTLIILSNKVPYNYFTGSIFTVGNSSGNMQQLAIGDNQTIYFRIKSNNSWSNWEQLDLFKIYTAQNWLDLNTAKQKNISIEFASAGTSANHVPVYQFQGAVFNVNDTNYGGQIAIDKTGKVYGRGKNATAWGNWIELARADTVDSLVNNYCILSEFDNITCLGDSLTYGSVYYGPGNAYRQAKKPYPSVLAVRTGSTVANVSQSGIDPKTFVSSLLSNVTEKTNHLCIVYLGTNGGGLTDTIDTDASGTDKSQYDLTTQTGSYCYIVKYCIDIGAKVLLVKCPSANATTNEVIGKVAEKFTVAVIENERLPSKYCYYLNGSGADSIHYNDFGYAAFADYLIRQVDNMSIAMTVRIFPDPLSNS